MSDKPAVWAQRQRKVSSRLKYYYWASQQVFTADTACPFCDSQNTREVRRKFVVTSLRECQDCHLLFRVPKVEPERDEEFYQDEYSYGFTTDVPDDAALRTLIETKFKGTEKNYDVYLHVLKAAGAVPGMSVLDFGASWGYGSWQIADAGYKVYAYEISKPRARYATEKLNVNMLDSATNVPEKVDIFFSAHVIEHLPTPAILWETAQAVVKPNGMVVLLMPNGNPEYEQANETHYHQLWGRVHPLFLTSSALSKQAKRYGFEGVSYTSSWDYDTPPETAYDYEKIRQGQPGAKDGVELLYIAKRVK